MIDTTSAYPSPSFPPDTQQAKLTKKQKKALAFRDKTNKNKTKNTKHRNDREAEMEDLHVLDVEKPNSARHAGASIQMGEMEDQNREGASGGSRATSSSSKKASGDTIPPQPTQEAHTHPKFKQKYKRVDEDGIGEYSGDTAGENKKSSKKRKQEQLDDVVDGLGGQDEDAEKKTRHKKRKAEKAEPRVDHGEEESEGQEMSEGERETEKGKRKERRFILFLGMPSS
jgi:hypothetical protein